MLEIANRTLHKNVLNFSNYELFTLRLYLVKLFFTPLMVTFFLNLVNQINIHFNDLVWRFQNSELFNLSDALLLIISVMFFVDVSCFLLGYLTESNKLNNIVHSVDPTISGWLVCLLYYPPFNSLTSSIIGGLKDIGTPQYTTELTTILTIVSLPLLFIYTQASVNLLFKASNLTYRGLVKHGVYSHVDSSLHPFPLLRTLARN
jgi:hypothetical protein